MRVRRLTLRWRVAAAFGFGALLLTATLAAVTWNLAAGYMLRQREEGATRQAEVNVRLVDRELRSGGEGLEDLLTGLATSNESSVLIRRPQGWVTSGRAVSPAEFPKPLLALAEDGVPARQRLMAAGGPVIAIALPVSTQDGVYVELFPLSELDRNFRFLSGVLVTGVVTSGVLGVMVGSWASRRALRPLKELTDAASRVAGGQLQARLPDQDDPELAQLAAVFNSTADALEARVRRDARFASDVSHELRSPLTTMANAGAVLQRRRGELSGTADRALELLLSEVERLQRTVVDLLEISRDDQQPDAGNDETVDLGGLLRNVVEPRPGTKPVIEVDVPAPMVQGDRRRLDRIVANLLDNADKYGGGAVRVAVRRCDGWARLVVEDAGPGVPEELKELVFERFSRGAHAGRRGHGVGSGLGLALVAQHVQRMGGRVWVEDRQGGGARFVVEIPEVPL
ncbi:HAMP domain-containing sensor histidine kinase [Pseudonocardia adelaidensis]|uniref:histidine kinase n=2 Tax=Pseudonocardia adelaidensis TaxID=648754 RepID=A0ABP9NLL3_9PSEU